MPATYEPIATQTVSSTTSVTFSSIPSTYTDLILVPVITGSGPQFAGYRFNGDTGTNYSLTALSGDGSTASSGRANNATSINAGILLTSPFNIFQVMNYANTSINKTTLARRGDASFGTDAYVGLWRSTSAINSITMFSPNSFSGTLTLYGIKAA